MKKFIFLILLLASGLNSFSQSEKKVKNQIVKTNVLGLFTLFYEHGFSQKTSLQVGLQYNPQNFPPKDLFITSIAPEFRYYLFKNDHFPTGIFSAIYTKYQYMDIFKENKMAQINALAFGLNFGYQYIFKNGIATEVFAGGGYNLWKRIDTNFPENFPESEYNYDIRVGISLGYAF